MSYRKRIEITSTGMVVAEVLASDGRRVGLDFFAPLLRTIQGIERHAKKAHNWADRYIAMCERQEIGLGDERGG